VLMLVEEMITVGTESFLYLNMFLEGVSLLILQVILEYLVSNFIGRNFGSLCLLDFFKHLIIRTWLSSHKDNAALVLSEIGVYKLEFQQVSGYHIFFQ